MSRLRYCFIGGKPLVFSFDRAAAIMPRASLPGLFGDHQPSLPETFAALGFTDELPDYELWSAEYEEGFLPDLEIKDLSHLLPALQTATQ